VSDIQLRPSIPAKRYFTLAEVEHLCGTTREVIQSLEIQLWPERQSQSGYRRFYQHHEVLQLRRISLELQQRHPHALASLNDLGEGSSSKIKVPELWIADTCSISHQMDWSAVRTELLQIRALLNDIE
jgi:hypothetical protein